MDIDLSYAQVNDYIVDVSINRSCMYMSMIVWNFVMRLTDMFKRYKGKLSLTKWKYLNEMISKRYVVCE